MQASLTLPLFDALLPTQEQVPVRAPRPRPPVAEARPHFRSGALLSLAKLHERLSLLARLELPCTILVANPRLHLRHALIRSAELADGNLSIVGDDFTLYLRSDNIHSIRLADQRDGEETGGGLEICHAPDIVYASIRPASDSAVWRDVMDNPTLSLS